jgi:hypothetical protein
MRLRIPALSRYLPRSVAHMLIVGIAVAVGALQFACASTAQAQAAAATSTAPKDAGWPRSFSASGYEIVMYQPQVESWEGLRDLQFQAALRIQKTGQETSRFAIMKASATTWVDMEDRTVIIGPRKISEITIPSATPAEAAQLKTVALAALPDEQPLTMSLDRMLAAVALGQQVKAREAAVSLDPPTILASDKPAVLVTFAGKPRLQKVGNLPLMYVVNTNWDIFFDGASGQYFLLNGNYWMTTRDLEKGPWTLADRLPADLARLPNDDNWKDVRANLNAPKPAATALVLTSTTPTELIVTDGAPEFELIPGTRLMTVTNTESDLFYHTVDQNYYLLAAGRWFRARALAGPWIAATRDLPADFKLIPPDSDEGEVLACVPGTPQAAEAVIQASIPQTAVVSRKDVTVAVTYDGAPKFVPIQSTTVSYAVNSPYKVFLVDGKYYCCHEGVWFTASAAAGPWAVSTSVPGAIYTIPSTHPTYNVTYVYVYDSTPDTVIVGATAGYSGQYVSAGVVLFGAGVVVGAILADDDSCWTYHYHAAYFSYGSGVFYSHYHGGYFHATSVRYGPYGGAGAWAAYNPASGVYSRGAYRYGPAGSAMARQAYNPWTGNYAAQVKVDTPYGSWGRSVVTNGDEWAKAGHRSGPNGTTAGVITSEGSGIVARNGDRGNGVVVAKDKEGDVYVGHDGNIYRRDDDGNWNKRNDNAWDPVADAKPTPRATTLSDPALRVQPSTNNVRPTPVAQPSTMDSLDRTARSRDVGNLSARQADVQRNVAPSSPGGLRARSSGGSGGRGGRGGGGRGGR